MFNVKISNGLLTRLMNVAMQFGHADLAREAKGTAIIDSPESDAATLAKVLKLIKHYRNTNQSSVAGVLAGIEYEIAGPQGDSK